MSTSPSPFSHLRNAGAGRRRLIAAALVLAAVAAGCSGPVPGALGSGGADPGDVADPGGGADPPPPATVAVLHEIIAHVSPRDRTVTFSRPRTTRGGLLDPESIDDLTIEQDGVPGSGSTGTVELVTNSTGEGTECPAGYQGATFCGNVTLRHFLTRPLANVFVQVVSVRDASGNLLPDHAAINSDASELGLSSTYGLWKYTAPAATTPGVLGLSPDNAGARDWVFANPDDADTYVRLRVVASLSYADYTFDYSSASFVDACSVGTSLGKTSSATQTMPFPFTLYGSTSSTIRFNKRGMITLGSVSGTASGTNVALPSSTAPKPGLFVFWDDIGYGSAGSSALCYATVGSAPNRQYVVTWEQMDFVPTADHGATLTFSAILSEGTNQIDLVYDTMSGPTSRADGASATVGVQDGSASSATAEYDQEDYGSGNAYAFVPIP